MIYFYHELSQAFQNCFHHSLGLQCPEAMDGNHVTWVNHLERNAYESNIYYVFKIMGAIAE